MARSNGSIRPNERKEPVMNTMNKWASTLLGIFAFGAALLTSGPAKADCNNTETANATSPNVWFSAAVYCAGGGHFADLNFEAGYSTSSNAAITGTTGYVTDNNAPFLIATEVQCSDGQVYYSNPVWQGPYYAYGPYSYVYCPAGTYPTDSWGFGLIQNP
jgi:hypothetical protein